MSERHLRDAKTTVHRDIQERIGKEPWLSPWVTIDQTMIDAFAGATLDDQWIHTDPERTAQESEFGTTIAHGYLSLSLTSRFAMECLGPVEQPAFRLNYGFNHLRFLSPVICGDRIRGKLQPTKIIERKPGQLLATFDLTVEIENRETPALVAEWLVMTIFSEDG